MTTGSRTEPFALGAFVLLFAALAGCASAPKKAAGPCALRSRDSTYLAGRPVFRDCAVDRQATLIPNNIHPDWTPPSRGTACYFVEMEFVVDESGRPERETATVVRTNDASLATAWMGTLAAWKFEPAMRGGVPVRQIFSTHQSVKTSVMVVPMGSAPPSRPPASQRQAPNC